MLSLKSKEAYQVLCSLFNARGYRGQEFLLTLEGVFQHSSDYWTPEHFMGVLDPLNFCRIYIPPSGTLGSYQGFQNMIMPTYQL